MDGLICEQCGEKNDLNTPYCERCGSQLTQKSNPLDAIWNKNQNEKSNTKSSIIQPNLNANVNSQPDRNQNTPPINVLLQKTQLIYLFAIKKLSSIPQEIKNQQNHIIGKIHVKSNSIRKLVEFKELDDSFAFLLDYRPLKLPFSHEIKSKEQNVIGKIMKSYSLFHPASFQLYDQHGKLEYKTQGNPKTFDFTIIPENNPLMPVAIIKKKENMNNWPIQNIPNSENLFGVRILDPNCDRRKILALIIAVTDSIR